MAVLASSRAFRLFISPLLVPHAACAMYEQKITMCQVRPEEVQADHVELTIKGMFVPRADLYRFLNAINGETAYGGKMFNLPVRNELTPTDFTVARQSMKKLCRYTVRTDRTDARSLFIYFLFFFIFFYPPADW